MRIKGSLRYLMLASVVSFLVYGATSIGVYTNSVISSREEVQNLLAGQKQDPVSFETGSFVLSTKNLEELKSYGVDTSVNEGVDKVGNHYIGFSLLGNDNYAFVMMDVPGIENVAFYNLVILFPVFTLIDVSVFVVSRALEKKALEPLVDSFEQLSYQCGSKDVPFMDEGDSKVMVAIASNATSQVMKLNKEVKDSSERMLTLLNYLPNGLILLNSDGKPLLINDSCKAIFSKVYPDNINPDKVEVALDNKIKDLLKERKSSSFDWERNGKIFNVVVEVLGEKGTAILFNDVTEERKMEETKRDFFIYASHQMKTPLTTVLGYLEMIQGGIVTDPNEIKGMIGDALNGAKKLRDMIRDMLDLSKTESDRARAIVDVDVAKICGQVIDSLKEQCLSYKVRIIKDLQEMHVEMDKVDCERLLNNLIANGIKYNKPDGYVVVSINNEKKTLIVRDSGVGIPAKDLHRIFERFYRGSNIKADGTGLGLAIVKHICQRYGFQIDVSSTLGVGSTFVIKF